jgi:anti-anti-sigma regulatory factor
MDLRIRLLLIVTPLIVLLLAFTSAIPFLQARIEAVLAEQDRTIEKLVDNQQLILAILREHDIVGHLVEGENDESLADFTATRTRIVAFLAEEEVNDDIELDRVLADRFGQLAAYHDSIVESLRAGDRPTASARFEDPNVDESIESILELGTTIQERDIALLNEVTRVVQQTQQTVATLIGLGLGLAVLSTIGLALLVMQQIARPLNRLTADAERFASGTINGELSAMPPITQLQRLRNAFQDLLDVTIARQQQLEESLDTAKQQVEREQQLRNTIQALSVPVVPLREDTLFLPLVGYLDPQRTSAVSSTLLQAIEQRRAQFVIIDLTGLANLDGQTATGLRTIADAARLLGARLSIVGVRPDQALELAQSGLSAGVTIARDIPAALNN